MLKNKLVFLKCHFYKWKKFLPNIGKRSDLIFKYGVDTKNILNTYDDIFTKDMVIGKPIKVKMRLTDKDLAGIYKKMYEIDFVNYPENFSKYKIESIRSKILSSLIKIFLNNEVQDAELTPEVGYFIEVRFNSINKKVLWNYNSIFWNKGMEDNLDDLANFIQEVIESKRAYKKLSSPRSSYL